MDEGLNKFQNDNLEDEGDLNKKVAEAVSAFIDKDDIDSAVNFLRTDTRPRRFAEFCLQIQERFSSNDVTAGFLTISQVMEKLVQDR